MLGDVLVDLGGDEDLHAELDLALFRVDSQDLRLDDLPRAQHIRGVVQAALGCDLADVDQALDAVRQLHKSAEVHQLGDGAFDLRADGKVVRDFGPGVGERLLQAERDAVFLRLDAEDDGVHAVALLEHVAGVAQLLAVGHLRDVDEALDAGFNLDKRPKIGQPGDRAGDALPGDEAHGLPGLGLKLLEAKGDFFGLRVDFEDFELEFLANGEHVFRLGDADVGDVADVQQAVDAAQVDECAVGHDAADRARDRIALLHRAAPDFREAPRLLFKNHAPIDNNIFVCDIELGDTAGDLRSHQLFQFRRVLGSAAAGGHEGADTDIDRNAALDDLGDGADDGQLLGEGSFQSRPVAGLRHLETRKLVVVLLVASGDRDREAVAGLDGVGVRVEGRAGQHALSLVADVEEDLLSGERDDDALELALAGFAPVRVAALEVAQLVGKGLLRLFDRLGDGRGGWLDDWGGDGLRLWLDDRSGDRLHDRLSYWLRNRLNSWLRRGYFDGLGGWLGGRLWGGFGGGQGFFVDLVGHSGLTSILPRVGRGPHWIH